MPIQVVATYKKIPPPPVDLVSAGDDVFPLCDITIFLEAIVDPIINIQGHTIDWVQLTGTPVILIDADTLTPSYLQIIHDETDKEFEVTIDKDLPDEQRARVIVYATPTSLLVGNYGPSDSITQTPADAVECNSITVSTSALIPPPAGGHDDDVAITEVFAISWDLPPDPLLSSFLTDMVVNENGIPVATYLPLDTLTYFGGPNVYSITSNYIVNGNPSSETSCTQDFTQEVIPSTRVIDDRIDNVAFDAESIIKLFPNNVRSVTDNFVNAGYSRYSSDAIVSYLINTTIPIIPDSMPIAGLPAGNVIIVRFYEGGIGGG